MISVQTLDRKIWRKDLVISYLHRCVEQNTDAVIDFHPEGSCAEALGMYRLLDEFCQRTAYKKNRITIRTGNMLERHEDYCIDRRANYWYEVNEINTWLAGKTIESGNTPRWHFANFVSRSNWPRLWIATVLDQHYKNKTLQTYHYDPERENYNYNGYIGLDDLVRHGCDCVPQAAEFVQSCPRTIDIEYLQTQDYSHSVFQHHNSYYPIQHPANLNLLQYYADIFVDIVVEPNVSGNCFLCTEKIWRPIIARRPFVVMSNFGYLENLKRLGFKTFNNLWDESYDDHSEGDRVQAIQQLLEHISTWSIDELHSKLTAISSVLDHNYKVFRSLTHQQIKQAFENP